MCFWRACRRVGLVRTMDYSMQDRRIVTEVSTEVNAEAIPETDAKDANSAHEKPKEAKDESKDEFKETPKVETAVTKEPEKPVEELVQHNPIPWQRPNEQVSRKSWTFSVSSSSSSPRPSSSDEEEESEEETEAMPLYNIYLDENTMTIRFNTIHQELKETLSHRIVRNYVDYTVETGQFICQVKDVLKDVEVPSDATHMIVTFCNFCGDEFSIPFDLDHLDDPFPVEDMRFITDDCHVEDLPRTLTLMHKAAPNGPVVEENMTHKLLSLCWKYFRPGFTHHRKYSWSWLAEMTDDKDAVLVAKYDGGVFASLELATSNLTVYQV